MPTPAERQALLFLAAVAVIGGGARMARSRALERDVARAEQGPVPSVDLASRALEAQIAAVDSARRHAKAKRAAPRVASSRRRDRPTLKSARIPDRTPDPTPDRTPDRTPDPLPPIDVNDATAAELERLPRIGPALAARIVAWRDKHGPFDSLESLRHVRGIGPATARLLAPLVTFSGRHSPSQSEAPASPDPHAPYVS